MPTIAFVTYSALPTLSADDRLAVPDLERRGARVAPVVWSDAAVPWSAFDAVVLRSTWDYHRRPVEFRRWLDDRDRDGAPLWNPAPLARWNMDKRYLRDLDARGVLVAPTRWVPRGTRADLGELMGDAGWTEAVIKPTISATAFETMRVGGDTLVQAQTHLDRLATDGDVMVQGYLPDIGRSGEWSLVFLLGTFSHAVLKRPRSGDYRVQTEFGGSESAAIPPAWVLDAGQAALRTASGIAGTAWLYARVDGVETSSGFVLLELEMLEPTLFLGHDSGAPARFADAVLSAASGASR